MTNKIVIAKPGYNALTETNPDNLVYSSDYDTLKYYKSGELTKSVTAPAGTTSEDTSTFTHSLGYYPYYVAYISIDGSTYYPHSYANAGVSVVTWITAHVTTTALVLTVRIENSSGSDETVNATCKYKIYRNNIDI